MPGESPMTFLSFTPSSPAASLAESSVSAEPFCEGLACRRLSGPLGAVVHSHQAALHVPGAQPAKRFGFPGTLLVVDGGQAGYACVAAEDQVGQGPAREVGGRDPLPRVATRSGYALGRVVGHGRHPVAGYGQRPSPRVGEPSAFEGREPVPRRAAQHLVRWLVPVVLVAYTRAVVVWRAPAPEQYAPVFGTREVVDRVTVGRHTLAALPADAGPPLLGQGLGKDDEGVDREYLAAQLAESRQVGLTSEHDRARAHLARVRHQPRARAVLATLLVVRHGGPLEDHTAEPLDGPGEPAREPRGVDGRAMQVIQCAPGAGDPDALCRLIRAEQPDALFQAEPAQRLVRCLYTR